MRFFFVCIWVSRASLLSKGVKIFVLYLKGLKFWVMVGGEGSRFLVIRAWFHA